MRTAGLTQWALTVLIAALLIGCRSQPQVQPGAGEAASAVVLRVLVVDDPALAKPIESAWQARGGEVVVKQVDTAELLKASRRRLATDVVIFPSRHLGELVGREWIKPLDGAILDAPQYQEADIFRWVRRLESEWGDETFAVPLGTPALVLLYRPDLLEKLNVAPPATWREYQTLAELVSDPNRFPPDADIDREHWLGAVEPRAADFGGLNLLCRAASYLMPGRQLAVLFDAQNMQPSITQPPFARALDELAAAAKLQPTSRLTIAETRQAILEKRCAVAVTWLTRTAEAEAASGDSASPSPLPLACAALPGSDEFYQASSSAWERLPAVQRVSVLPLSGRCAALAGDCRALPEAVSLLTWLGGELSVDVSSASAHTSPCRGEQLAKAEAWLDRDVPAELARQYAAEVQAAYSGEQAVAALRIPGADRYLAALHRAVTAVLDGTESAAALSAAAAEWETITDELGRTVQRDAYLRSIGLAR